ncbi:MAG: hypothetical protein EOO22_25025 [Comamonadaceae bacterium]|nr:MAG: hypothetical protein EOO22_25025 [Comamonadaceae bacterium]
MASVSTNLLSKGIFALAVVAIVGTVGVVQFAQAEENTNVSGYGTTGEEAAAAADTFQAGLVSQTVTFTNGVKTLQATAEQRIGSGTASADFNMKFDQATNTYAATTASAFDNFRMKVTGFANTAESKDKFIDQFNNAKATYLNELDAAKNQFAAAVSPLGDNANQAKDQFMNGFNSSRDAYGNNLEQLKNDFAATVS